MKMNDRDRHAFLLARFVLQCLQKEKLHASSDFLLSH